MAFGHGTIFRSFRNCLDSYRDEIANGQPGAAQYQDVAMVIIDRFPSIVVSPDDAESPTTDIDGNTALHIAARCNAVDVVRRLLLDYSDGPNRGTRLPLQALRKENLDNKMALTVAIQFLNEKVVQRLLRADPTLVSAHEFAEPESEAKPPLQVLLDKLQALDLVGSPDQGPKSRQLQIIRHLVKASSPVADVLLQPFRIRNKQTQTAYVRAREMRANSRNRTKALALQALGDLLKELIFQSFYHDRTRMEQALYTGSNGR